MGIFHFETMHENAWVTMYLKTVSVYKMFLITIKYV